MSEFYGLEYLYDPETNDADPMFSEGVTDVWLYQWGGKAGPARALKMAALADDEGTVMFEPNGEWQGVTVTDS